MGVISQPGKRNTQIEIKPLLCSPDLRHLAISHILFLAGSSQVRHRPTNLEHGVHRQKPQTTNQ